MSASSRFCPQGFGSSSIELCARHSASALIELMCSPGMRAGRPALPACPQCEALRPHALQSACCCAPGGVRQHTWEWHQSGTVGHSGAAAGLLVQGSRCPLRRGCGAAAEMRSQNRLLYSGCWSRVAGLSCGPAGCASLLPCCWGLLTLQHCVLLFLSGCSLCKTPLIAAAACELLLGSCAFTMSRLGLMVITASSVQYSCGMLRTSWHEPMCNEACSKETPPCSSSQAHGCHVTGGMVTSAQPPSL